MNNIKDFKEKKLLLDSMCELIRNIVIFLSSFIKDVSFVATDRFSR